MPFRGDLEHGFLGSLLEVLLHPVILRRGGFQSNHLQCALCIKAVPVQRNSEIYRDKHGMR